MVISLIQNGFTGLLVGGISLIVLGLILVMISGVLLKKEQRKSISMKEEESISLKSNTYASMFSQSDDGNEVNASETKINENEVSEQNGKVSDDINSFVHIPKYLLIKGNEKPNNARDCTSLS